MKKLLVSFSGGETSAYMAQWLWKHKRDEYEMAFVFANTGQENEETLDFVQQCSEAFGFPVVWVEAVVNPESGKGTTHRIVEHGTASRDGQPFEQTIAKYGIPNHATPHCTRELKQRPITSCAKDLLGSDYETAIGIRMDEHHRINWERARAQRFIYPLVDMVPMTKPKVNFWWSQQPFRLRLKGYQGNCMACWKKSDRRLYTIAKERPEAFAWVRRMEEKYGHFVPPSRMEIMERRGEAPTLPVRFFRGHRSVQNLMAAALRMDGTASDDSLVGQMELDMCDAFSCNSDDQA